MSKLRTASATVRLTGDGATGAVDVSSGLLCPDAVLRAMGERFAAKGAARGVTTVHPIAAGDMFGTKGVDDVAHKGMIARISGGFYPTGPTNAEAPLIWRRIPAEGLAVWSARSGIVFDTLREGGGQAARCADQGEDDMFADPVQEGCAMNASARKEQLVRRVEFDGDTWLHFPAIRPEFAIIRATTADENGNRSYEHEGAVPAGCAADGTGRPQLGRDLDRAGQASGRARVAPAA